MATILDEIIAYKRQFYKDLKKDFGQLESSPHFERTVFSLKKSLHNSPSPRIIAEFKRQSPSKGLINATEDVQQVVQGYARAGAVAVSVLTDEKYFGGSSAYLQQARAIVEIPLLRKDFVVHEYQILEAKALGADLVLLIAAALSRSEFERLSKTAHSLGLEVLLEVHTENELAYINAQTDLVGVNNRNLKTFEVDLDNSLQLAGKIPAELPKIAESGISLPRTVQDLFRDGFSGFLMGEFFMKHKDPSEACATFINKINGG